MNDDRFIPLPGLRLPTLTPADLERLLTAARRYRATRLRFAADGGLAMAGIGAPAAAAAAAMFRQAERPHCRSPIASVITCRGAGRCPHTAADTVRMAERLASLALPTPLPAKVKIGVAGCPRCCTMPLVRDLGLIGSPSGWRLAFGGNGGGRPRIGDIIAENLSDEAALATARACLSAYCAHARTGLRTSRFLEETGVSAFTEMIGQKKCSPLTQVKELSSHCDTVIIKENEPAPAGQTRSPDYGLSQVTETDRYQKRGGPMKQIRKIIRIDEELCNGCGLCVPDCAEGSLQIIDGKAKLVADNLCDGLGACLGSCPTGALTVIEREADEFDEEAVEAFLADQKKKEQAAAAPKTMDCGCASTHIQSFKPLSPCQSANQPKSVPTAGAAASQLTHWPIQIRLIPPHAPFLQGADVLVAADCTAAAAPGFQEKYLAGKVVMMGCPKFDDAESYIERFAAIIDTCNLKSLTILIMEVPCCSAMNTIVRRALERASATVPVEQITISTRGEEIARVRW